MQYAIRHRRCQCVRLYGDIPNRCGTPVQRIKVVSIDVRFVPLNLIGYHSNVLWATRKRKKRFRIFTSIANNAKNLVKIGSVYCEIFRGICLISIYDTWSKWAI